jgi:predicted nucleic acid-binding Zn ribbon protein
MGQIYYIIMCRNCGTIQTKIIKGFIGDAFFKCFKCEKRFKLKKKNEYGLTLKTWGPYDNGSMAAKICAALKAGKDIYEKQK